MKVLVTGAKGQLGIDVVNELAARDIPHVGVDVGDFDISNMDAVFAAFHTHSPTAVIHCAAYTAVDKAEDEPELCRLVNEVGTRNIAEACRDAGAKLLYISTDYVFPGHGDHFHLPDDPTGPVSVYGETKLAGEKAVLEILDKYFIVRISGVYGVHGHNFVKTMLRLAKDRDSINVVCDQVGSTTYTSDLAHLLCQIIASEKYGIFHATNEGTCSWAEFAEEIFRLTRLPVTVNHIPSSQYPTKARRPHNFRLDKSCLDDAGFQRLPHWKDALKDFLHRI